MKIGFFGGSFNPPTKAHLSIAEKALKKANLDKVIFIPMGDSYLKEGLEKSKHRYNMLDIACKAYGTSSIEVSDLEIKENKKMYAIDAFRLIENTYPNDEKFFIMGADNFINLLEWKESKELIENYNYIIIERGKINLKEYIEKNNILRECSLQIIKNEEYKTNSSSEFRELLENNKAQNIVQKEVYDYIIKNDLYRKK